MTSEWKPIESIPRNGTWVLVHNPDMANEDCSGVWVAQAGGFNFKESDPTLVFGHGRDGEWYGWNVTHWAPFPLPPKPQEDAG